MRRASLLLAGASSALAVAVSVTVHPAAGAAVLLVAIVGYALSGRAWPTLSTGVTGTIVVGGVLLSFVALFPTALYLYVVSVGAGLCGDRPVAADVASVAAYGVVASRGLATPRRLLVALPVAVVTAASVFLLVRYPFASAHVYCET